jgi:outer membrane protein assembly factor BamB/orotate phosphoribosyltransferase-like protein
MNVKSEILTRAVKLGHGNSNFSFDTRELLNGSSAEVLITIADDLWLKIKHLQPEVIFGKGVGSYPLLLALKMRAYLLDKVDLSVLFIRDQRKSKGDFRKLVEGSNHQELVGKPAIFVDDIFNSGNTFKQCKEDLFNEGFSLNVCACVCMIDFEYSYKSKEPVGVPIYSFVTRSELGLTRQDADLPKILPESKWVIKDHFKQNNHFPIKSTPVVIDGKIFVGSDDTSFSCYDLQTGKLNWKHESLQPQFKGSVCIASFDQNKVYWSGYDGFVNCSDKDSYQLHWSVKVDDNVHASICVDGLNKRLFTATEKCKSIGNYGLGDFICLDSLTGQEIWRTPSEGMIPCTPVYDDLRDMVICGSNDFHLYFLCASTGRVIERIPTRGEVRGQAIISEDKDFVFFSTDNANIYCVELKTLQVLWQTKVGTKSHHAYPVVENGFVYTTNASAHVVCIKADTGKIVWVCRLRGVIGWSITCAESCLVVGTTLGHIVTIDKKTGLKLSSEKLDNSFIYQKCIYDKDSQSLIVSNNKDLICYGFKL